MSFKNRVLVIDDEPQIHRFLSPALQAAGYEAKRADNGQEGLRAIALWSPDAVVLDLGLPDMDGKDVLAQARAFYVKPIIILSARDRESEKIEALDLGANDYMEKPFGVGELMARIRALLRLSPDVLQSAGVFQAGNFKLDFERREVSRSGVPVRLRPKEYDVLAHLARSAGKVLSHKELLTVVWGPAHREDTQYLRVVIGQLRHKLEDDPAHPQLFVTVPGIGYKLSQ